MNTDSLVNKPYGDRQFIVVVDDAEDSKEAREWWKNVADGIERVGEAIAWQPMLHNLLLRYASKKVAERIREAHNLNIPVLPVPASVTSELKLPPGHPRTDLVYVAHPSDHRAYYPFASFHRLAFESKFAEVMSLLGHLGATDMRVKHVRGWGKDFAGNLSVKAPKVEAGALDENGGSSDAGREILYDAKLPGHNSPSLPDDQVWYPHEPTWQSVAESRMEFGLSEFSLELQYTDHFDVTADIAGKAKGVGFSLGGSFESFKSTTWSIEGTFAD